jgi:membrane-associated phospholipid phosphatase
MLRPILLSLPGVDLIKNNEETIAHWVSSVVSPHIVGVVLTSLMALNFSDNPLAALRWLLLLLPLIVLPPLGYIVWLVRTGVIVDIYMPERRTRLAPLAVLIFWLIICLSLIRHWQAPPVVEVFVLSTTVLVSVLSVVTLFWKISFHSATISAAVTATLMITGASSWPVALLVPLVGWSRVRLRRHTLRQVIYGAVSGAVIALLLADTLWQQLT